MKTFLLCICLACSLCIAAQTANKGTVSIIVHNQQHNALDGATAELLNAKDSSLVKAAVSDKKGLATFESINIGTYLIKVLMTSYEPAYTKTFTVTAEQSNIELSPVALTLAATQLKDVEVNTKKPFIQKLNDRIVVNVESSIISAGSSAFEILERSPGVTIDQNDAIRLRGKQGVIIMIDGKITPLSGTDLANYLHGLPANAIDRIDIITNPSAKYDAAGNSGIIDIHMKKDQRLGANGTFTAGYGQGVYPKANTGFTFNYRNKKLNIFGNYNYVYRKNLNHLILNRNFYEHGVFTGADDKDNYTVIPVSSHTLRLGADFFAGKKTIIGFVVNSNFLHYRVNNNNNSVVSDSLYNPYYTFQTLGNNNDHNNNMVANINFKHTFDSTGKELTADVDYGVYNTGSLSSTATKYYNLDGTKKEPDYILDGNQDGQLTFKTAKADYSNPMKNGAKWEAGFKTSFVSSDNDVKFYDMSSGTPVDDVNKTNHFIYNENDNAAYINVSKELKKFNVQLGLRGEHTDVKTQQIKGDIHYDTSYFQLFPSGFFNYKLKADQTLGVSISRRIERPGYSSLNPFLFLIDVTTYATGNPGLLPELTWSYELNYTVKQLNFTLGYSHTKNNQNIAIAKFKDVFPGIPSEDNVTVQIPVNLKSSDYYGLSIAAPVRVNAWWNMVNNADIYYNYFNGNLGTTTLNNGSPAADIRSNNSFTLKKGWTAELNGSFNSGGRYGFMVSKPQWALYAGVQKNLLKNKATLRLNITDIFWTNLPRATITYDNYIEHWHAYRETRVANITFTYRFGNAKVAAARRRTTASEEEKRRAGN
jgi:iron complex outermembrane receptor protein